MKSRLSFFFLLFLYSTFSIAQIIDTPSESNSDTLETIESDTSVIYVIQAEPVTVIEKIEVVKAKAKYFLSINFSFLQFSEFRRAHSSYEEYVKKLNAATDNLYGYSIGASLWKCPKKTFLSYNVFYYRLNQLFQYTNPNSGNNYVTHNYFNYFDAGISLGHWFRKNKPFSWVLCGGAHVSNLLSYSAYTLNKSNPEKVQQFQSAIDFREFLMDLSIEVKFFWATQNTLVEIDPFFLVSPFSATPQKEPYTLQRSLLGIKVGFSNKLF